MIRRDLGRFPAPSLLFWCVGIDAEVRWGSGLGVSPKAAGSGTGGVIFLFPLANSVGLRSVSGQLGFPASPAGDLCLHTPSPLGMAPSCPQKWVLSPGQSSSANQGWRPLLPAPPASLRQRFVHLRDVLNPWIKLGLKSALPLLLVVFRSSYPDLECWWSLSHSGTFLSPPEAISSPAELVPRCLSVSPKCWNCTAPEN